MSRSESGKKNLFYTILILLPFLIIVLLESGLRIFSYGDDLSLFIPASDENHLITNNAVGKRFFSTIEQTRPIHNYFLKVKPDNGYRIFILGESTVQGFPYDANVSVSRIIEKRLRDIFPHRSIEVINLGMTAINSYTLLDFTDEIIEQKPDLVLIYTGHNEYYGALGVASIESGSIPAWLKKLNLTLIHFRTYQLLRNIISGISNLLNPLSEDEAKGTLMQHIVGRNIIPYKSEMYNEGLIQFRDNMSGLLGKLKDAKVSVIISDLTSNIRDLPPFYTVTYGNQARADSLFYKARRLEKDSLFEKAKEMYTKAKDLDAIRFRASEDLNKIIYELAGIYNCLSLSVKTVFERHSPHGIVGDNLMTEHLHPNIDGYFLMADGFINEMKKNRMIENEWDSSGIKPSEYYRYNWGFTALDSMIADLRIKNLKSGWPFQPDTVVNNFIFTYRPEGIIDSLAFMTVKYDNVSPDKVHKDLAAYYQSAGSLLQASREYFSLAYISPDVSSYYQHAADLAYKGNDYDFAVRILDEWPYSDTSTFAQFTLASIYSSKGKYYDALECIERLEKLNLNRGNYLLAEKLRLKIQKALGLNREAEKTLASIKKLEPDFNDSAEGKPMLILIPEKLKPYIERAEKLRRDEKFDEALAVLGEANRIQETAFANLLIGKILLKQNSFNAIIYFEKAYSEIKDDPVLIYNLSVLYLMKNDFKKAKVFLDDFLKLRGNNDPQSKRLIALYEQRTGTKLK